MVDVLQSPIDFCKKIAETFNWKLVAVEAYLEFEEDKEGFFWAKLKPKMYLENHEFRVLCTLTKDLGGQDYLKGTRAWKVPGVMAKKSGITPQGSATPTHIPTSIHPSIPPSVPKTSPKELSGVTPNIIKDDKSRPQITVPLKALSSLPFQSRTRPEVGIDELAESIRAVGVLHAILVRPKPDGLYEVVMGERRVAAARKLGFVEIPANIRILNDKEAYEIQFSENIQREDLTDIEKAHWLYFMTKRFGYTQEQLAQKLGKTQGWVSQHLAMLQIPESITRVIKQGELTEHQVREILAAPENKQQTIIDEINKTGEVPSAREIHELVHGEPKQTVKPQDMTVGKARELLDTPAGKEVLEIAVKEKLAEGLGEEHLYADGIKMKPDGSESVPIAHELGKESIPSPKEKGHPINLAEFTCDQCNQTFMIRHLPSGKHSLIPVREEQ